ncbi:hypothetical protein [Providencia sp. PROV152]|uniref:hypothetical protein n=1 Tax=Providencia sp. PROV152 TaxID=2949862 RepID=UPI002349AF36|nr:hypothetical protein [Providencia sp. PROV152]
MYFAILMNLYSLRLVGWHFDKRMTAVLVSKTLMKAYNLRHPEKSLVFHSDRDYNIRVSAIVTYRKVMEFEQIWAMSEPVGIAPLLNDFLVV